MPRTKVTPQSTARWPVAPVSDIAWTDALLPAVRQPVALSQRAVMPTNSGLGYFSPTAMVVDVVVGGLLGIVDRIVHYRLEAQRIDAQTECIRMQTKVMCKKIDREFELRMAELDIRRNGLLKLCQQGRFEQESIRLHLRDKQVKADSLLKAALAAGTPPEKMHLLLDLYRKETEGCTVLLQMSSANYKNCLTQLLPALSTPPKSLALTHNP